MSSTKPFGNLKTATILVIGHDPRLQKSLAEAEKAFFFDYLEKYDERPTYGPDASKYDLAHAVWNYVNYLTDQKVPLENLFVTNLCNEFLPPSPGSGTVLIPDEQARSGVEMIQSTLTQGNFHLILPMAVQTFYHLCRLGFLDEDDERITTFTNKAQPSSAKVDQGVYRTKGTAPFLDVCGNRFHHNGIPVVPIVHVKQWPLTKRFIRYEQPMQNAKHEVKSGLVI